MGGPATVLIRFSNNYIVVFFSVFLKVTVQINVFVVVVVVIYLLNC